MSRTNEPTLDGLPLEVAQDVCEYLDLKDLLNLRLVSRRFSTVPLRALSPMVAKSFERVVVLVTREDLLTFQGVCQIPEFRHHIRTIIIVPPRLGTFMEWMKTPEIRPFPAWQLSSKLDSSVGKQLEDVKTFKASEKAHQILVETFDVLMETGTKISKVLVGESRLDDRDVRQISARLKFWARTDQCSYVCFYRDMGFTPEDLHDGLDMPLRALQTSKLDLGLVDVFINAPEDLTDPFHTDEELDFGLVDLFNETTEDFTEPFNTNEKLGFGRSGWYNQIQDNESLGTLTLQCRSCQITSFSEGCLRLANKFSTLRVQGCDRTDYGYEYHKCDVWGPAILSVIESPYLHSHISNLHMENMRLDGADLSLFILQCGSSLQSVEFDHITLTSDRGSSWVSVFQALNGLPNLKELAFNNLLDCRDLDDQDAQYPNINCVNQPEDPSSSGICRFYEKSPLFAPARLCSGYHRNVRVINSGINIVLNGVFSTPCVRNRDSYSPHGNFQTVDHYSRLLFGWSHLPMIRSEPVQPVRLRFPCLPSVEQ